MVSSSLNGKSSGNLRYSSVNRSRTRNKLSVLTPEQLSVCAQAEILLLFELRTIKPIPGSPDFRSEARNKSRKIKGIRAMRSVATLVMALVVIMLSFEFESWAYHSLWVIPSLLVASLLIYLYWKRRCRAGEAIMKKEFEDWANKVHEQLMIVYKNKGSSNPYDDFTRFLIIHQNLIRGILVGNHDSLNWVNSLINGLTNSLTPQNK